MYHINVCNATILDITNRFSEYRFNSHHTYAIAWRPLYVNYTIKKITKYDIQLINALNTADIISLSSPFMTKHLGDKGLFSSISILDRKYIMYKHQ